MERPWLRFYEKEVPPTVDCTGITLADLFDEAVRSNRNGTAISYFGKRITYGELGQLVNQFATALSRLGVKQGDRVAIMLPNIPQYVVFHFAVLRLGGVVVPTNPLYMEREIGHQIRNSGAETLVTLDFLMPKLEKIWHETPLRNIIVTTVQQYLPLLLRVLYPIKARREGNTYKVSRRPGIHFYHELLTEKFGVPAPKPDAGAEDIAMLLYTGGTTGVSKGAVLTHKNLVYNVTQIRTWYNAVQPNKEVVLCALPFFHSYGLTTCLHISILLRSKMVLVPNPRDIKKILKLIEKERATLFSGVPTLFVAINHFPDVEKYDLSSIKTCVSGGAPLPLEVARRFEQISGGKLVEGYGLSETSPVTHANPILGHRKEGSIGTPLPSTDARIVDQESKEELPVDEVGELAIRGPQVMNEYWEMPEETANVMKDGWLFTGDVARMDEDGYFYIVDRKKDMIIAGGFNIFPREIEEVLFEHDKIIEAAVIGVPDEYRGETVKAFVVPKSGGEITEAEILEFCRERLAPFKVPKMIEFADSLPKSNIGKVLRRVLKEQHAEKVQA